MESDSTGIAAEEYSSFFLIFFDSACDPWMAFSQPQLTLRPWLTLSSVKEMASKKFDKCASKSCLCHPSPIIFFSPSNVEKYTTYPLSHLYATNPPPAATLSLPPPRFYLERGPEYGRDAPRATETNNAHASRTGQKASRHNPVQG